MSFQVVDQVPEYQNGRHSKVCLCILTVSNPLPEKIFKKQQKTHKYFYDKI